MTEVGDLASSCDGTIGPDGCSGLAIVSKYPFKEVQQQNSFSLLLILLRLIEVICIDGLVN